MLPRSMSPHPFPVVARARRDRAPRGGGALVPVLVALAIVALLAVVWIALQSSSQRAPTPKPGDALADQRARELAAAWFAKSDVAGHLDQAQQALAPLLDRATPAVDDLVSGAIVARAADRDAQARALLAKVFERDADNPRAHYIAGRLDILEGNFRGAEGHLRRALAGAPGDVPTMVALAQAIEETSASEAESLYRSVIEKGVDNTGSWHLTALFRSAGLAREAGRDADFERLLADFQALSDRGLSAPKAVDEERGNLGNLTAPPPPASTDPAPRTAAPRWKPGEVLTPEFKNHEFVLARDLDGDGDLDLIAYGSRGLGIALRQADQSFRARSLEDQPVGWATCADLTPLLREGDAFPPSRQDILFARGKDLWCWRASAGSDGGSDWTRENSAFANLPAPPADGLVLDYDHEGDLDLAFVGGFGLRILRNDGARSPVSGGGFTDVSGALGVPASRPANWILCEDFDTDHDVDLLFGAAREIRLYSNLRGGQFADVTGDVLQRYSASSVRPLCEDLDGDGRPDLWGSGPFSLVYWNAPSTRLRPEPSRGLVLDAGSPLPALAAGEVWSGAQPSLLQVADFDLDGLPDAAWRVAESANEEFIAAQLAIGRAAQRGLDVALSKSRPGLGWCAADLDGNGTADIVSSNAQGLVLHAAELDEARGLRLSLRGIKDNRRGVGAVVELRAGPLYRRVFWRGEPLTLGLGRETAIDWLRVTWPNGVVQYEVDAAPGERTIEQIEGLVGSCPFLYAWDGSNHVFVTDVLGITPLGLPMSPEQRVPPDHDEYVLIRGEQLQPRDGKYEIVITEELREVTYLDRVRLEVIDHPADTEIYPEERFCFPPFPLPHTHTVRGALSPRRAVDDQARDWTEALARDDGQYAAPFTPSATQFLGLCDEHALEVEFDPAAIGDAQKLRLLLTGWFYWTDASVNLASARDPGVEFLPPILQVPDGQGGWRDVGPPIGFPAGKTKTMIVDVGEWLLREDPRLRLRGTLRLSWDSIRLAIDDDDAPLTTRALDPVHAELWRRGFSEPILDETRSKPERFQWNRLATHPRWNPHPGRYTRYGDNLEWVTAVDDCFVILGSGDALTLRFDAASVGAPAPGMRRDFLLYLDGWAKDRDPNTHEALHVEPLPFHGMSGYPYGRDESFPDTAATRRWLREAQVRAPQPWIERGPGR